MHEIFRTLPHINAVVHTHQVVAGIPTTAFPQTPGTEEYIREPIKLLKKNRMINLIHHGTITIGTDLPETTQYVLHHSKKSNRKNR